MSEKWSEVVAELVAKFDAAVATGSDVRFNPKGAAAVRDLIKGMAERLDIAVAILPPATPPTQEQTKP